MGARSAEPPPQEGAQEAHGADPDQVRGGRLTDGLGASPREAPDPDGPNRGYPRRRRVTRGRELDVLRREGKRVRTEHLDVRVLASLPAFPGVPSEAMVEGGTPVDGRPASRVGIIVPKHKHSGVERNRLKRRLRELARLRLLPAVPAGAVLLRARPEAYGAAFDALARDVERAAREATRWLAATPPNKAPPGITPA